MVSNPFKRSDKDAPDPAQEEQEMAAQMQSAGANVETFDENTSPEAKGRAALKARDEVKPRGQFAEHQEAKAKAEEPVQAPAQTVMDLNKPDDADKR